MHRAWWRRWGSLVSMLIQTRNIRSGKRQVTLITNKHLILRHNLKHPTDCIMPHSLSNFQHQLKSLHSTCHWLYSRRYSFSIQRTEGPHWTSRWGEALGLKFQMGQAWGGTLSLLLRISKDYHDLCCSSVENNICSFHSSLCIFVFIILQCN